MKLFKKSKPKDGARRHILHRRDSVDHAGKVVGFVEYHIRRFTPDPNGPDIGRASGRRGYYTAFEPHGEPLPVRNLLTTDGRDVIHDDMYISTTRVADGGANRIALSSDTHTPVVGDTTLLNEITTSGLARIQATTRTHTDNTNVSTLEHTFTATAQVLDVQLSGLFNANSGVTLVHENTFTPADLEIDDELKVTWTITAG